MSKLSTSAPDKGETKSAIVADDINCISLGTAYPPCECKDMDAAFLDKLLLAQKAYGKKFHITSAFRSLAHEKFKGRNGLSSHCKGLAVDISAVAHNERLFIVAALIIMGFRRIGISRTFIHVDDDTSKVPSLWLYDRQNNKITF